VRSTGAAHGVQRAVGAPPDQGGIERIGTTVGIACSNHAAQLIAQR
jgi:hypothetical protein